MKFSAPFYLDCSFIAQNVRVSCWIGQAVVESTKRTVSQKPVELHSALKTEVLTTVEAGGTQLSLVRLIHGRDKSTLTLHANPTTFTTFGLQTTDVLSMLGFTRSACAFIVGSQCYARAVADSFDLEEFTRVFPPGSRALVEAERLFLDCGLTISSDEGWGYFLGEPSSRRGRRGMIGGDGHTSPKASKLKDTTDNLFRYVFTFMEGGSDKGWTTHIWPVSLPLSPEHQEIIKLLGLRPFVECPENDFSPCWWFFAPLEKRGDAFFDSNVDTAHKWFDDLDTKFSPAVEKITLAHKAFEPFGMPLLTVPTVAHADIQATVTVERPSKISKPTTEYQYDVAISYASEDIVFPEKLATLLQERGVRIFFDKIYEAELWGKDLYRHFTNVFHSAARYCVVFASEHYAGKLWTNQELRAAQARALEEGEQEYILPVRLDDTEIPGLLPTIKYVDGRTTPVEEIAELVVKKLAKH